MKVLLITYYFPPCNSIVSNRVNSFYDGLVKDGHEVSVVTRGWDGNENVWEDYLKSTTNTNIKTESSLKNKIHYLPYKKHVINKNFFLRKFKVLLNFLTGVFNPDIDTGKFYSFCENLIQTENFNYIIVSSPPPNIVKLGYKLKKQFPHIKLIVDFRDLQNHVILPIKAKLRFADKIDHFFVKYYLKKWLKKADHILAVTPPFITFLKSLGYNSLLLLNGFEKKILNTAPAIKTNKFTITVLGTIYKEQHIDFFIETVKGFTKNKLAEKVCINLIGIGAIEEVALKFKNELNSFCIITNKITRKEAIEIGINSCVLAYPGWKGYKGIYSGKIFEYLALKRHILIAPTDNDVIHNIVNECEAGLCVTSTQEGIEYLNTLYSLWENNVLKLDSNDEAILKYSRETQNKVLLNLIK